jgi:hypothetical protein
MSDKRETILAACLRVATAVEGIVAAARNATDVPGLARPAMLIHDGGETFLDKAKSERRSRVQTVELAPSIEILVGTDAQNLGSLINLFRARFLKALLDDPELVALLDPSGEIRYEGCTFEPITAESREARMGLSLVFTYPFRVSDL